MQKLQQRQNVELSLHVHIQPVISKGPLQSNSKP